MSAAFSKEHAYIFTSILGIFSTQHRNLRAKYCLLTVQHVWGRNLECYIFKLHTFEMCCNFKQDAKRAFLLCRKQSILFLCLRSFCLLLSPVQVNDCETEDGLCSATLSHAAPSSQGMAKVQDGHTNACDRYTVLCVMGAENSPHFKNALGLLFLLLCLCVCSAAL